MSFAFLKSRTKASAAVQERAHDVADRTLPLKIVENARAKRLTLRIGPGGQSLRITVPPGVAAGEVDAFLFRHQGWLEEKLAKLPDKPELRPGAKLPVMGVPHLIRHEPGRRGTVERVDENGEAVLIVHGGIAHLKRRLADHLKQEAKRQIEPLVKKHTKTIDKRAKSIRFRDTTSRWGSCTSDGALSFSWRIMMAPPTVIDYLVAHEVAHLQEMNHGPRFWALCKILCPRTDEAKAWLKRNGPALQAIGF